METDNFNEETIINDKKSGFERKLICITYPGIVNNVDNMLDTLGGISKLENAVAYTNKRLELRFRPKDIFCKPAIADKNTSASLLVKIIVKDDNSCDYEVVGVPTLSFTFNKYTDFQYLPLVAKEKETSDSSLEYVLDELYPYKIPTYTESLVKGWTDSLPFLPPRSFLRNDFCVNKLHFERIHFYEGHYRPELAQSIKDQAEKRKLQEKVKYKSYGSIFFNFKDKNVPTEPSQSVLNALKDKTISPERYQNIKEYFEKRPIWSKIALQHLLNLSPELIKILLPTVAYYHQTGPWRIMWVKYGYDPRTDPEARKYQTFDFRLRTVGGIKYLITPKRYQAENDIDFKNLSGVSKKNQLDENFYIFKPNILPPARQMLYQYCDLQFPKIQAMIARLPTISPGSKCHPKNGWLPYSFSDQCREILSEHIISMMQSQIATTQVPEVNAAETETVEASSSSTNINSQSCPKLEDTFDLMEISDTDDETDEESEDYNSSDEEKGRVDQPEQRDIDIEFVDEVNQLVYKHIN